jgi:cell wall-associated NlpC family hydrolase
VSEDERAAVVAEARTWIKTPWRHMADIKGAGVDCAMLLVRV